MLITVAKAPRRPGRPVQALHMQGAPAAFEQPPQSGQLHEAPLNAAGADCTSRGAARAAARSPGEAARGARAPGAAGSGDSAVAAKAAADALADAWGGRPPVDEASRGDEKRVRIVRRVGESGSDQGRRLHCSVYEEK